MSLQTSSDSFFSSRTARRTEGFSLKPRKLNLGEPFTAQESANIAAYQSTTNADSLNKLINQTQSDITQLDEYEKYEQRQILLQESARERMRMQNEILWVVFYTVALVALLAFVHYNFSAIFPDTLYTTLEFAVVVIGGIVILYKYTDYSRRDPSNFKEIVLPSPPKAGQSADSATAAAQAAARAGQVSKVADMLSCQGKECCATGTTYDAAQGKCIPTP